ncbi:MAG TPA: GldG family protein [Opitutaceae bacterium]|nr:GldG family protein [Opitutaceae bacterium]
MPALETFRTARWVRFANLVLQAALFVALFAGLNYLAGSHEMRFDLTRYGRYSLSPETTAYLADLRTPVQIVVGDPEGAVSPDLQGLLREYVYATEGNPEGRITVEYLDVAFRPREAERLGIKEPDTIHLRSGDNTATLRVDELYREENGQRQDFRGEEMITSAILNVSNPERKKIYFLVGHGELRPDDVDARGLSVAREQLRARNLDVASLDLTAARQIPADASLLISVRPQNRYSPPEQELLRRYLRDSAGRLILFLAPDTSAGLDALLRDWGVEVDDDLIRDSGPNNVTQDDDLIIRSFASHPITRELIDSGKVLRIGNARSVGPDPARAAGNGLNVVTLASTSSTAWGEVGYRSRSAVAYNPRIDLRPRPEGLGVAVASEPAAARDNLRVSVPPGRLVVFGTGDLIDNLRIPNDGVLDVLLAAVNWTVDRDAQLKIRPRPIERFQLSLSAGDKTKLDYSLTLALPAAVAFLGLIVYWTRRS